MEFKADEIRTYTGIRMDPFDIKPEQVRIEDIAHALSMMVRANGHLNSFFSIAQHCLNCASEAKNKGLSPRVQLACLLHDAAECYIADVPRPVKHRLEGYAYIERRVADAVYAAFGLSGLSDEELKAVDDIDNAMLYYEFEALTGALISKTRPYISKEHDFSPRPIGNVEREFLETFQKLCY
jgi:5'-deoxynucleotidase YfbR-like HD superfamily hydrolase